MNHILSLLVLILAALGHLWITAVLLVGRQTEILLFYQIAACVFWFLGAWICFLRKRKICLTVTAFFLVFSLALTVICFLEALDTFGAYLPPP